MKPPIARANPLGAVAATILVAVGAFVARTPAQQLGVLAVALLFVALSALRPRALLRRTWWLLFGAASVTWSNALLAPGPGLAWRTGLSTGVRVISVSLPGVLVLARTDPTDLADALVQWLHVPPRFAYGALAALRLMPLMTTQWQVLGMARRARGVDAGHSPVRAVRLFGSRAFALLVASLRQAGRLALAMDARGFDTTGPRSSARASRWRVADALLLSTVTGLLLLALWLPGSR